ncbi:uncharacterized protein LOC132639317 [Lycium barbarum]|uniref:uncharacterized protein LOC132639317 n=1 Tax=Lycium barbarum TaxID=112863 RepID=UPI00293F6970|nr:uncharacterized protein LOC132639317 [Lycium barbarum]
MTENEPIASETQGTRANVVEQGIQMFDRKPIIVKPWQPDIEVTKQLMDKIPVWIRLMGLDVKYWGKSALTKIAGLVGNPIRADSATTMKERMTYARVLVEVPLNEEYPTSVMFENEYGKIVEQEVEFEWKPVLCTKCKNFGHRLQECRKQIKDVAIQQAMLKKLGMQNEVEKEDKVTDQMKGPNQEGDTNQPNDQKQQQF